VSLATIYVTRENFNWMKVQLRIPRFNRIFYYIPCSVWTFIRLRYVLRHTDSDEQKKICLVIQPSKTLIQNRLQSDQWGFLWVSLSAFIVTLRPVCLGCSKQISDPPKVEYKTLISSVSDGPLGILAFTSQRQNVPGSASDVRLINQGNCLPGRQSEL